MTGDFGIPVLELKSKYYNKTEIKGSIYRQKEWMV